MLLSNSVMDNDKKILLGKSKDMIMIKHDKKDTGSYVKLLRDPSLILPKLIFSRVDIMFYVRYEISQEILLSTIHN